MESQAERGTLAPIRPVVAHFAEGTRERWDDPKRGTVAWVTLLSGEMTPTAGLSAGVAEFLPRGGSLAPHRHSQPELYFILEGTGIVTIDGRDTTVTPGTIVFVPGDAEHSVRNESDADLKLFYVFPTNRFADVIYRFSE